MKRILSLLLPGLLAAVTLFAQTPEEILARMDQETQRFDPEGFSMVMEIRVPLLGAIATTIYTRGDKYKMITGKDGDIEIDWSDGQTETREGITLKIEPGKDYYIRTSTQFGVAIWRPLIELVPAEAGKAAWR